MQEGKITAGISPPLNKSTEDFLTETIANREGKHKDQLIEQVNQIRYAAVKRFAMARMDLQVMLDLHRDKLPPWVGEAALVGFGNEAASSLNDLGKAINLLLIQLQHRGHNQPDQENLQRNEEIWNRCYGLEQWSGKPQSAQQIASEMDLEPDTVSKTLQRMRKKRRPPVDKRRRKPQ